MKETLFYYDGKQIHEEKGNYVISVGESVVLTEGIFNVHRVDHNLRTRYKVVVIIKTN